MDILSTFKKKRLKLEDIEVKLKPADYLELYQFVHQQREAGRLKPVKNSGSNGKNPELYQAYTLVEQPIDTAKYEEELRYQMRLKIDYYLNHMKQYEKDREALLQLNSFLINSKQLLEVEASLNERAFQIWQREKFLQKEGGKTLLKNVGLTASDLNFYETAEPIAYYTQHKKTPQTVLIIENKDTFYSMRKHLLEGNKNLLGVNIGTLIYGGGKNVTKAFRDFAMSVEPYLLHQENEFFYFGDLDYEGIQIYHSLARVATVHPFVPGYQRMLTKASGKGLPKTKKGQNRNLDPKFFDYFGIEEQAAMKAVLEADDYIPQEILSIIDF